MKEKLKDVLREIYQRMLEDNRISELAKENYCCMAPYVGSKFPTTANDGIILYGRANNGWNTGVDDDYDIIYDKGPEGLTDYIDGNRSPFFRVAGKVFSEYYGDDWFNNVAYSNLYKVAPSAGNPEDSVCDAQWKYVTEIFKKEIETLLPKFVVLFTGKCWADDFIWYINGNAMPQPLETIIWDEDYGYSLSVYKIGEVYYLVSEHPQGKPEQEHADAILRVIQDVKEGRL